MFRYAAGFADGWGDDDGISEKPTGRGREIGHQNRAGDPGQARGEREGADIDRGRVDADDLGGFEIIGDGAHRFAPGGQPQQQLDPERRGDRHDERDDLRLRQEERPEHHVLSGENGRGGARIGRR